MSEEEIKEHLKMAFWDVNYSPDELYDVFCGKNENDNSQISKERIYQRLMETFSWYKILEIVPREQLNEMLQDKIIEKIWYKGLRKRFYELQRILRAKTLSTSK